MEKENAFLWGGFGWVLTVELLCDWLFLRDRTQVITTNQTQIHGLGHFYYVDRAGSSLTRLIHTKLNYPFQLLWLEKHREGRWFHVTEL